MMKIIDKIESKTDKVTKYIFQLKDGLITEFSYLDKNDGKDIICVSTQTLCVQRCLFCHVTDHVGKLKHRNITADEIITGVKMIINDQDLIPMFTSTHKQPRPPRECLLISFMGCGEPLENPDHICTAMEFLDGYYDSNFKTVRFAMATMIPKQKWKNYFKIIDYVQRNEIQLKVHLSLHYTDDVTRNDWMPNALPILPSIASLANTVRHCGISGEIHYALIEDVNDTVRDAIDLNKMLDGSNINVKFLYYNEKDTVEAEASVYEKYEQMAQFISVPCEYYKAPGLDVGASCGQFLMDYYEKYNQLI